MHQLSTSQTPHRRERFDSIHLSRRVRWRNRGESGADDKARF
uniref:Uncharacterized protein n=1 Tax=Rhizophora mucronata TaxID=61149 RepID=A0A2P2LHM2_RHIMU